MQNINWDMMTQFVFPEQLGIVEEVVSVEIKPIWQQVETDDSVRLVGIYHIAAVARFNPNELPLVYDGIYIDDIDFVEENNGYFEYALPLEIDLPREKVDCECQPEICVKDVNFFVFDGSNCTFKWNVDCQFEEAVAGELLRNDSNPPITEKIEFGYDAIFPEIPEVPEITEVSLKSMEVPESMELAKSINLKESEESSQLRELPIVEEPKVTKGQTSVEKIKVVESVDSYIPNESQTTSILESDLELMTGIVLDDAESQIEVPIAETTNENIVESINYFSTDTDDFYNDLTESYTLLNLSNKVSRK